MHPLTDFPSLFGAEFSSVNKVRQFWQIQAAPLSFPSELWHHETAFSPYSCHSPAKPPFCFRSPAQCIAHVITTLRPAARALAPLLFTSRYICTCYCLKINFTAQKTTQNHHTVNTHIHQHCSEFGAGLLQQPSEILVVHVVDLAGNGDGNIIATTNTSPAH